MSEHDADETVVTLKGIRKSFSGNEILKGIDLEIYKGEVLAILGSSGSGKTTLLRCVNALEQPDAGIVRVDGTTVDFNGKVSNRQILELRRKTAMVFQNYNLFKNRTVLENVTQGLTIVRGIAKDEARERAIKALSSVGMDGYEDRYPIQLSGGQQQRVRFARNVASRVVFVEKGKILEEGSPEQVIDNPQSPRIREFLSKMMAK